MVSIYAGYTTLTLPGWERFAEEVKAPANYKDPVKIASFIEDAKKRRALEASEKVLTGMIADLAISDDKGVAKKITIEEFIGLFPGSGNRLVCYKPYHLLRFVVAHLAAAGKVPPAWAVRSEPFGASVLGNEEVAIVDPIRALIGHAAEDEANLPAFVQRFNIKFIASGAEAQALLALKAGNLIGV